MCVGRRRGGRRGEVWGLGAGIQVAVPVRMGGEVGEAKSTSPQSMCVIGTKATIKSNVYARKIKEKKSDLLVESLATPLLAPMIEEGFFNNNISKTIINSYLSKTKLKKVDALVLACTHYPLIKKEINEFYDRDITILDSGEIVAEYVKKVLSKKKLLATKKGGTHHFYVSDFTPSFEKSTKLFFKEKIHLELKNLWQ